MSKKIKPNVFLAIPITSDVIKAKIEELQKDFVAKDKRLKEFVVTTAKAHITLVVFHVEEKRIEEAKEVVRNIYAKNVEGKDIENIVFDGIGKFGSKVIYAKPVQGLDHLKYFNKVFTAGLSEHGFEVCGDGFTPHLTIFKGRRQRGRKEKKVKQQVILDTFNELVNCTFGEQEVEAIQFLSMKKGADENGYYFCEDFIERRRLNCGTVLT